MLLIYWLINILAGVLFTFFLALFLGFVSGWFQASREASYKARRIKHLRNSGIEFFQIAGDPQFVEEMREICVATIYKTQQLQEEAKHEQDQKNTGVQGLK